MSSTGCARIIDCGQSCALLLLMIDALAHRRRSISCAANIFSSLGIFYSNCMVRVSGNKAILQDTVNFVRLLCNLSLVQE